jgi:hypothetical protein
VHRVCQPPPATTTNSGTRVTPGRIASFLTKNNARSAIQEERGTHDISDEPCGLHTSSTGGRGL